MIRLYFNSWADYPLIWSVDRGTQETEVRVTDVRANALHTTEVDQKVQPGDRSKPRVWLQYSNANLTIEDGIAFISEG